MSFEDSLAYCLPLPRYVVETWPVVQPSAFAPLPLAVVVGAFASP